MQIDIAALSSLSSFQDSKLYRVLLKRLLGLIQGILPTTDTAADALSIESGLVELHGAGSSKKEANRLL